jgi:uncharacterized membrane protein
MNQFWISFIKAMIIFLILDYLWIGIINYKNYMDAITAVQGNKLTPRYFSAFIVYIAMTLMVVLWTVPKVKEVTTKRSDLLMNSFKYGGTLGLLSFAIFNFTNNTIFTNWDLHTAIVDTLWGFVAMGTTTYLTAM